MSFKKLDEQHLNEEGEKKFLDTLYQKLQGQENDSVTRNLYFKIAFKYYDLNSLDKYLKVSRKVHELAIDKNDSLHIAKSLYYLGDYYDEKAQLDSAFSYYSQSEKVYNKVNDTLNTGRTKLYKAGVLFDAGIFSESEVEGIAALKLLKKTNNTRLIYECYNLIGISLKELNNCEESLKYFDLALKQLDQLERENYDKKKIAKSRIICFNNIGRVYEKLKEYPEAIRFYNKGLQTKDLKLNFPKSYALLLDNLAYSKMKEGEFNGVEKLLFESLKIRDSLDIEIGVMSCKINIGEYYLFKKDTPKALSYIKEGLTLSKKIKSSPHTIQALKLLMENDFKNKNDFTAQYFKINDSLQEVERITKNKFARIAFETDQVVEKNEILSERNTYIVIGSGIIILVLVGFFVIFRLKSRNKELSLIKEQQEANEKIYQLLLKQQSETERVRKEERNRIAMELHDGIINSVFATRFNLQQLDTTEKERKEMLVKELEKAEVEIRRISHDLSQNLLFEDKSFTEMITDLVKSQQNQSNTRFDLSLDKYIDWSSVSSASKMHIYRIIQEALQNINKYSKAKRCVIILLKTEDKITIRVWDNGIGFNPEKVKKGIGLRNMQERTEALNGELKITSEIGKGTRIEIVF
ncbi:tetratricopeptide repeat-containing sensor histidine kinase [Flavobacterium gilvum]|uniref:histidine kinase n=1 Tax=Flavobacterium gilvum TaxID=1492737 RepID=A0AAC9I7N0_9FLAO|nr:sensor histidine kinase [Flavobacterium gilvum]AOW10806.1 hypothetical protein EM308_15645 [Flavobacterium gilvum]KFC59961.1 histidine kinase [Flavobacterium gilvum]